MRKKFSRIITSFILLLTLSFLVACSNVNDIPTETSTAEEIPATSITEEESSASEIINTKGTMSDPYVAGDVVTFEFYGQEQGDGADLTGTAQFELKTYEYVGEYKYILFDTSIDECSSTKQLDYGHYFTVLFVDENYQVIGKSCFTKPADDLWDWQSTIIFSGGSCESGVLDLVDNATPAYLCIYYCSPENSTDYYPNLNDYSESNFPDSIWFKLPPLK